MIVAKSLEIGSWCDGGTFILESMQTTKWNDMVFSEDNSQLCSQMCGFCKQVVKPAIFFFFYFSLTLAANIRAKLTSSETWSELCATLRTSAMPASIPLSLATAVALYSDPRIDSTWLHQDDCSGVTRRSEGVMSAGRRGGL